MSDGEASLPWRLEQLVVQQAQRTPDAPAIREGNLEISYRELIRRADGLADALGQHQIGDEDLVALWQDRSAALVIAILGILRTGAAYVPIDPRGPAARRKFVLDDARPRAVVTTRQDAAIVRASYCGPVIEIDNLESDETPGAKALAPAPGTSGSLAYVMYTSGSTGIPKGVLNQHDGICNHIAWMAAAFPLAPGDRVLAKTAPVFDVSVWECFWPLASGACLVIVPPDSEKDPAYLVDAIARETITDVHFVPTMLRVLLQRDDLGRCRSLRRVICSGEALTAETRDGFFAKMPGPPVLLNLYGPTETAVHVTGCVCAASDVGPVSIGHALPDVRAYIVDSNLRAVASGERGELLIGGVQVARGYLNQPDQTAERFIPDPFSDDPGARCYRTGDSVAWRADGAIDFFGRLDSQVQIGGVRVELGEIEAALRRHPAVADAAVLARGPGHALTLVAYLRRAGTNRGGPDPSVESIRRVLVEHLADYMMPGRHVWMDAFPLTASGKLDRRALPVPLTDRANIEHEFEAPLEGTEATLAEIWRDELGIDRVGRHDGFSVLGGTSFSAIRMLDRVGQIFGVALPPAELVRSPTIARLASRLDEGRTERRAAPSIVPLRAGHSMAPLVLPPSMGGDLHYWKEMVTALEPGRAIYGFTVAQTGETVEDLPAIAAAMTRDLMARQPDGPFHLAGYSFSGALAFEIAQQLRAAGRQVGVLAVIDYGPGAPDGWKTRVMTIGHFFANLPHWLRYDILQAGWTNVASRAWRKISTVGGRVGREEAAYRAQRAVDHMFDREQLPEVSRRLVVSHLNAMFKYQPRKFDGDVLLVWARCRPLFHSLSPSLGWEHYAHNYRRVVITGNHDNILRPPQAEAVARAIDEAIRDWERVNLAGPNRRN